MLLYIYILGGHRVDSGRDDSVEAGELAIAIAENTRRCN